MKSVDFPQSNVLFKASKCFPESVDTHAWQMSNCQVTCFVPTEDELAALEAGSPLWLVVAANPDGGTAYRLSTVNPFFTQSELLK